MKYSFAILSALTVITTASSAFAQLTPVQDSAQPQQQPVQQQPVQQQPVQQQQTMTPVEQGYEQPNARQGRGVEYGAHLLVPLWLGTDEGVNISPGLGIQGRGGWEFGSGLTAELNIGLQFNSVDSDIGAPLGDSIVLVWGGVGARYSVLNPSAVVPFVGAGIGVFFGGFCADDGIGGTECGGDDGIGLKVDGVLGVAYELSSELALEGGVNLNMLIGGQFDDAQALLSPFVGATLYY